MRAARPCACASWLCRRCGGTAGTGGINSSAGGAGCLAWAVAVRCDRPGYVRLGRRYHVDEPYSHGGMGSAIWAHVGGRRRRRHLRHRRRQRHLLQGRVGQHQRRCAGRTTSRGDGGGGGGVGGCTKVLQGVLRGYYGVLLGTTGGTAGEHRGTKGTAGILGGTTGY